MIVAEWGECENLLNGNKGHAIYDSGRVTNGHVVARIDYPGTYCIVLNNRFSMVSNKVVSGDIATYSKIE